MRTVIAVVVVLAACGGRDPHDALFQVVFTARSDDGAALAGVAIEGNGRSLGVTDSGGELRTWLRAREGAAVRVRAACPEGYRPPDQPPPLTLRRFASVAGEGPRELGLSIECRAAERLIALVINTDRRAGLPVVMNGRELARTSAEGVAHVGLRLPPNTTFQITLDTASDAALRPRSPVATFSVGDADSIALFDQRFVEERPAPKPRRRRANSKPAAPPPDPRPTKLVGPERTWRSVGR